DIFGDAFEIVVGCRLGVLTGPRQPAWEHVFEARDAEICVRRFRDTHQTTHEVLPPDNDRADVRSAVSSRANPTSENLWMHCAAAVEKPVDDRCGRDKSCGQARLVAAWEPLTAT